MLQFIKKTISAMGLQEAENAYALNNENWKKAMDMYEAKDYVKSINQVLKYINPQFDKVIEDGKVCEVKEGSSVIRIEIKDNHLNLRVNFLKHDGDPSISLLRKLAKMNMDVFTLSVVRISDNDIYVDYSDRLELSHPMKIYNIIDEMLYFTDLYDDLFVKKYGVSLYNSGGENNETPRSNIDELWNEFQANIVETEKNLELYKSKKYDHYMIDPYFNFYNKNLFCLNPEGYVKSVLIEMKRTLSLHLGPDAKVKKLDKYFQSLKKLSKEEFAENMYESLKFFKLNGKAFANSQQLQAGLNYNNFDHMHTNKQFILNSVYGEATVYNVLNRYIVSKSITKELLKGLEKASGKDDQKRSEIFVDLFKKIHTDLSKVDHLKAA